MIKASEIKAKAERKYQQYLRSAAEGKPFERIVIPCDKSTSDYMHLLESELKNIISLSKEQCGYGYTITWKTIKKKNLGVQDIPVEISFETEDDFLKFIRKETEARNFKKDTGLIVQEFPQLAQWTANRPQIVVNNRNNWPEILKVLSYFCINPKPNLYLRELPIDVHTKFIEQNKDVIRELLDILIAEHINAEESNFEKRFNLKYDEPLVRLRILDDKISEKSFNGIDDMSLPVSQLRRLDFAVKNVFVVENKINFLAFPKIPQSIVIWGHGYGVTTLKDMPLINNSQIYYWGDIDVQGFEILSQFRGYYPSTISLLMDRTTFDIYFLDGKGKPSNVSSLDNLTEDETMLYHLVKQNNWRLEQEKIPQKYLLETLHDKSLI